MRKSVTKLVCGIVLSGTMLISGDLFAWGAGHDYVQRGSIKIMPKEIKAFLGKENLEKFVHWSHAPDSFTPFKVEVEKKKYPITDEEIAYLKNFKKKSKNKC